MKPIFIYNRILQPLLYLLLSLIFVIIIILLMMSGATKHSMLYDAVSLLLFGSMTVIFGIKLLNRKPQLIINIQGLQVNFPFNKKHASQKLGKRVSQGFFAWTDINMSRMQQYEPQFILFTTHNDETINIPKAMLEKQDKLGILVYQMIYADDDAQREAIMARFNQTKYSKVK